MIYLVNEWEVVARIKAMHEQPNVTQIIAVGTSDSIQLWAAKLEFIYGYLPDVNLSTLFTQKENKVKFVDCCVPEILYNYSEHTTVFIEKNVYYSHYSDEVRNTLAQLYGGFNG